MSHGDDYDTGSSVKLNIMLTQLLRFLDMG